jgi:hypothetical protein
MINYYKKKEINNIKYFLNKHPGGNQGLGYQKNNTPVIILNKMSTRHVPKKKNLSNYLKKKKSKPRVWLPEKY